MTLYLDVIWLLNWLFDCLLLSWTAVILKMKVSLWRIAFGGLLGSMIILLAFTPYRELADQVPIKLLFSVVMIVAVFGFSRWMTFIKRLACLYFITFLSGGILLGLHFLFEYKIVSESPNRYAGINAYGDPMSWVFVLIGFPIAWQFSRRTLKSIEMNTLSFNQLVEVSIKIDFFECTLAGFIDSGNQLYDPITRSPVMIVSLWGSEDSVPPDMLKLFKEDSFHLNGHNQEYTWSNRIRIIPCKVVGKDHQLLTAIKPDLIRIKHKNDQFEIERGFISFTLQQLSPDNRYQCIVHPKMLSGVPTLHVS